MISTPAELSRSGDYIAGEVALLAPIDPDARRRAVYPPPSALRTAVGREADFELDSSERAWLAVELDKAGRYRELIQSMARAGQLALRPGYTASASGLYQPTSWALHGLHYSQAMELLEKDPGVHLADKMWSALDGAGTVAAIVKIIEDDQIARLPTHIWAELDRLVAAERNTHV